jgi:hypothetical protein
MKNIFVRIQIKPNKQLIKLLIKRVLNLLQEYISNKIIYLVRTNKNFSYVRNYVVSHSPPDRIPIGNKDVEGILPYEYNIH